MRDPRKGVVLPVVLVSLFLLASMVLTFQFLSSSDYKQVGRLVRSIQATALADLAADEVYLSVASAAAAAAAGSPPPQWVKSLLDALDGARATAASGVLDVKQDVPFDDKIPMTKAAAAKTAGLVDVSGVRAVAGPFSLRSTTYSAKSMYAPPELGDAPAGNTVWDLKGALNVEVSIKTSKGPLDFSQKYLRGQELLITDTTPPAPQFALFSYMPPVTADYACNDLQRGGRLTVEPKNDGRVHVRGPLVLLAEEVRPSKLHLGGRELPARSKSYPDRQWLGWGNIPGPRTLQQPQKADGGPFATLMQNLAGRLPASKSDMPAQRPANEASHSKLITEPFPISVTVDLPIVGTITIKKTVPRQNRDLGGVSMVLAADLTGDEPKYLTVDEEALAYYPPAAYFYGPIPAGRELYGVKPIEIGLYRGVLLPADTGRPPSLYQMGTAAPAEGDCLAMEPLPTPAGAGDVGVLGVFGSAVMPSYTYGICKTFDLGKWIVTKFINEKAPAIVRDQLLEQVDSITGQLLAGLGVPGNLDVLFRRFVVSAPPPEWEAAVPKNLSPGEVANRVKEMEGLVSPYGFYFHAEGFWKAGTVPDELRQKMIDAIKTPLLPGLNPVQLCDMFLRSPTGWQQAEAQLPNGVPKEAEEARQYLRADYSKTLLARTPAKDSPSPEEAVRVLMERAGAGGQPKGIYKLAESVSRRPKGVLGDYWGAPPAAPEDMAAILRDYPNGFFPPQFRDWEQTATRVYEDMTSYLAAERAADGVLELKGAVLIKRMDYPGSSGGSKDIRYRGRGIVIAVTAKEDEVATLDANVRPAAAGAAHELILAHRVDRDLVAAGKLPALKLGAVFEGSVYSDTGVQPIGTSTRIVGNLVTGLLNKAAIAASSMDPAEGLYVQYRDALKSAAAGPRQAYWSLEQSGEVVSVEPGS